MQTPSQNKMIDGTPKEYFFSGGLQYRPQTVMASSQEEAQEIYEKTRKPRVEPLPETKEQTS
jgi:hypothetical protein